ncbi:hypothetical protein GCM10022600_28370 [Qipengyuania pelagi]|uniref:hypothetical protein n=1 Tax=Qipengyuania pelagi TaxID=994320 RepID=UPI002FE7E2A8
MDVAAFEKRQSIVGWRDALVLASWKVVNDAGIAARTAIESEIDQAGIYEAVVDPSGFARDRIDSVMRERTVEPLRRTFAAAAEDLREIDVRFRPLADALENSFRSIALPSPATTETEAASEAQATPSQSFGDRLASLLSGITGRKPVRHARDAGSKAFDLLSDAGDAASQLLQSGTGLHARLRGSAGDRVREGWMASSGDPAPLMAQITEIVEKVANEARSITL